MVTAGLRGRKSGRGFYTYESPNSPVVVDDALTPSEEIDTSGSHPISSVGLVGTGTMAAGIAEVLAKAGKSVVIVGRSDASAKRVRATVENGTAKAVDKGKLEAADRDAALSRISISTQLSALAGCDLVIECIVEEIEAKTALFRELDTVCRTGAILATTTSSLPVVDLAAATSRPGDVIGIHFFNPAPIMKLVEIVTTVATRSQTLDTARAFVAELDKHPVVCGDRAGFIVNALLFPYLNDAIRMVEVNYASTDDIDLAMKRGCGLPMGPFELLDTVGLDVALEIQRTLYLEFREPGFAPAPRLEHLVTAGYLGRKTGRGFRIYES
jgi:3-hydroxybutyryl-CoA dehydrogenase